MLSSVLVQDVGNKCYHNLSPMLIFCSPFGMSQVSVKYSLKFSENSDDHLTNVMVVDLNNLWTI